MSGKSLGQLMKQTAPEAKGASYSEKPLGFFERVRVKIPALSSCREVAAHTFKTADKKEVDVEAHLELRSCPLGQGGYVQRNFYGFDPEDLGKNRVASVTALTKFSESGKKILLLDIRKAPVGTKAASVMKFCERRDWALPIPNGGGIRFIPLSSKTE
ncbi:MAG: hypothetical protein NT170_03205 [Candidatus Moranbacteria bacterium]|nr:hypothetical protein [Candidatus Moranbacteria bacterium]